MCGIFGIYSPEKAANLAQANAAADRIRHRGPDGFGSWQSPDGQVCLAHRRLSLVSIENGQQPIFSEDNQVTAVVNGEFYGHREIRKRLESLGHQFRLDCDSEIAVHLYQQYGLDFVEHLNGEFAFLIWDQKLNRLIAVRDRFGIKPLVYSIDNQRNISFASEAKALLPDRQTNDWDLDSFFWAANLQYLPPDRTLFAGIKMIPPGHFAIVDDSGFRLRKYWDLDYPKMETATRSVSAADKTDAINETRRLLKTAVMQRLDADAPVCFHLSGGLDSSSTLGIASFESGIRQQAFTIGFDSQSFRHERGRAASYDETNVAIETAKFCDAELQVLRLSESDLIDNIMPAARASEGLSINGHLPAKFLLNREIQRQGFAAAITGEGADETFLGYAHLKMDWWNSQAIPFESSNVEASNRSSVGMMLPHGDSLSLDSIQNQLSFVPSFLAAKATLGFRVRSLLNDDLIHSWNSPDPRDAYGELIDAAMASGQLTGRTPIHQSAWLWTKLALAGYILKTLGDGTEMASSIEGRLPFLDHQLFEFTRMQPIAQMFDGQMEKRLLREAVKQYVTPTVYRRKKHPFDSPPLLLSESPTVREFLFDQINSQHFDSQPMFDRGKVIDLLARVPSMDQIERQVWDPVFMMICSALGVQQLISESRKVEVV